MTISNLMKLAKNDLIGFKTLWEKEKLLVTSNFFFSHSVFKRLVLQTRENQGLFGKGLRRVENILGKENMLVTSMFSFSNNVFQKVSILGSLKVRIVWKRVNCLR